MHGRHSTTVVAGEKDVVYSERIEREKRIEADKQHQQLRSGQGW
jgi:hypothetical protein